MKVQCCQVFLLFVSPHLLTLYLKQSRDSHMVLFSSDITEQLYRKYDSCLSCTKVTNYYGYTGLMTLIQYIYIFLNCLQFIMLYEINGP